MEKTGFAAKRYRSEQPLGYLHHIIPLLFGLFGKQSGNKLTQVFTM